MSLPTERDLQKLICLTANWSRRYLAEVVRLLLRRDGDRHAPGQDTDQTLEMGSHGKLARLRDNSHANASRVAT